MKYISSTPGSTFIPSKGKVVVFSPADGSFVTDNAAIISELDAAIESGAPIRKEVAEPPTSMPTPPPVK